MFRASSDALGTAWRFWFPSEMPDAPGWRPAIRSTPRSRAVLRTRSDCFPTYRTNHLTGGRKVSGVSESDLLFDTWAWWEYLRATSTGKSLRNRYLRSGAYRVHTSVITLAELSAKLWSEGHGDRASAACGSIRRLSHIWEIDADIAQDAGPARTELRKSLETASLADAIIVVTSRRAGARLVSGDPAFAQVPGIIRK